MEKRRKALVYVLVEIIGFLVLMTPVLAIGYHPIQPAPVISPNTPPELSLLQIYAVDSNMSDALVQYEPNGVTLQIQCSKITSIARDWYGFNPHVEVNGQDVQALAVPDIIDRRWSDTDDYKDSQDVNPSLTTRIPITANEVHQTLHIHVSMDVTYPDFTGETTSLRDTTYYYFVMPTATVTRDLNLFVLTSQEMQLKEDLSYHATNLFIFSGNNLGYLILALLWLFPFGIVLSALTVASIERHQKRLAQASAYSSIWQAKRNHSNAKQIIKYSVLGFFFFLAILIGTTANIALGPSINSAGGTFNYVSCFAVAVVVAIGMFKGPKVGVAFGQASLIPFFLAQYVNHIGLLSMLYFGLLNCFIFALFGFLPSKVFRATKNLGLLAVSYISAVAVWFVSLYLFYTNWQSIPILVSHFPQGSMTFFFISAANSMVFATVLNLIIGGTVVWACAWAIDDWGEHSIQ